MTTRSSIIGLCLCLLALICLAPRLAEAAEGYDNCVGCITSIPAVWGKGQPGTAVTIKEGGATLGTSMTDINGDWSFLARVNAGAHNVVASQTDLAGNTGSASLTFPLDTQYYWGALSSA